MHLIGSRPGPRASGSALVWRLEGKQMQGHSQPKQGKARRKYLRDASIRVDWPDGPFKIRHLVASGLSRIIIPSGIAVRLDPAQAGCYFLNGLLTIQTQRRRPQGAATGTGA